MATQEKTHSPNVARIVDLFPEFSTSELGQLVDAQGELQRQGLDV